MSSDGGNTSGTDNDDGCLTDNADDGAGAVGGGAGGVVGVAVEAQTCGYYTFATASGEAGHEKEPACTLYPREIGDVGTPPVYALLTLPHLYCAIGDIPILRTESPLCWGGGNQARDAN